ncbi:hypothetical protein HNP33_004188 [Comamonas odontotermitis]|uniref:Uncharacterized protein n=1 Tax=Comamonas odontotermitis TaxID=379895 RepID=A0ABR6RLL6_9BURK|nr:hypothetical protein [Comamonas odontotermitis]
MNPTSYAWVYSLMHAGCVYPTRADADRARAQAFKEQMALELQTLCRSQRRAARKGTPKAEAKP